MDAFQFLLVLSVLNFSAAAGEQDDGTDRSKSLILCC